MVHSSTSAALRRRILKGCSSSLLELKMKCAISPSRPSSSFPFDEDIGTKELPPQIFPKLFVSELSRLTTDENLKETFSPCGQLLEAKVITDRVSERSKGFGFVSYATIEEAGKARHAMNASSWMDGLYSLIPQNQKNECLLHHLNLMFQDWVSKLTRQLDGVDEIKSMHPLQSSNIERI